MKSHSMDTSLKVYVQEYHLQLVATCTLSGPKFDNNAEVRRAYVQALGELRALLDDRSERLASNGATADNCECGDLPHAGYCPASCV